MHLHLIINLDDGSTLELNLDIDRDYDPFGEREVDLNAGANSIDHLFNELL